MAGIIAVILSGGIAIFFAWIAYATFPRREKGKKSSDEIRAWIGSGRESLDGVLSTEGQESRLALLERAPTVSDFMSAVARGELDASLVADVRSYKLRVGEVIESFLPDSNRREFVGSNRQIVDRLERIANANGLRSRDADSSRNDRLFT